MKAKSRNKAVRIIQLRGAILLSWSVSHVGSKYLRTHAAQLIAVSHAITPKRSAAISRLRFPPQKSERLSATVERRVSPCPVPRVVYGVLIAQAPSFVSLITRPVVDSS